MYIHEEAGDTDEQEEAEDIDAVVHSIDVVDSEPVLWETTRLKERGRSSVSTRCVQKSVASKEITTHLP